MIDPSVRAALERGGGGADPRAELLPRLVAWEEEHLARYGEMWRDVARHGETWRDMARCGERWREMARDGERWGKEHLVRERPRLQQLLLHHTHQPACSQQRV